MAPPKKPPPRAASKAADKSEQSWLRHFLIVLGLLVLLAAGTITYYVGDFSAPPVDAQVPVSVTTMAGDGRSVQCKVNLVVAPDKEEAMKARMPMLRATISETLANTYQQPDNSTPDIRQIPDQLRDAINGRLPPSLKVREVLIQHLLFGLN